MVYNHAHGTPSCIAGRFPVTGDYITIFKPLISLNSRALSFRARFVLAFVVHGCPLTETIALAVG